MALPGATSAEPFNLGFYDLNGVAGWFRSTERSIRKAFPKAELRKGTYPGQGGGVVETVEWVHQGEVIFRFDYAPNRKKVFSVLTTSPKVAGPFGLRAGLSTLAEVPDYEDVCARGFGAMRSQVICVLKEARGGKMRLRFDNLPGGVESAASGTLSDHWGTAVLGEVRRYRGMAPDKVW